MKSYNIVKKLEKEGYKISYKKWAYWDGVPHVELDGFEFVIADRVWRDHWQSCRVDFIYNEILQALYIAQKNNPVFLKKIEQVPADGWYYGRYLIRSMEDYYQYKKNIYPYNESWEVMQRLNREFK